MSAAFIRLRVAHANWTSPVILKKRMAWNISSGHILVPSEYAWSVRVEDDCVLLANSTQSNL